MNNNAGMEYNVNNSELYIQNSHILTIYTKDKETFGESLPFIYGRMIGALVVMQEFANFSITIVSLIFLLISFSREGMIFPAYSFSITSFSFAISFNGSLVNWIVMLLVHIGIVIKLIFIMYQNDSGSALFNGLGMLTGLIFIAIFQKLNKRLSRNNTLVFGLMFTSLYLLFQTLFSVMDESLIFDSILKVHLIAMMTYKGYNSIFLCLFDLRILCYLITSITTSGIAISFCDSIIKSCGVMEIYIIVGSRIAENIFLLSLLLPLYNVCTWLNTLDLVSLEINVNSVWSIFMAGMIRSEMRKSEELIIDKGKLIRKSTVLS
jgi:hypothetical protein